MVSVHISGCRQTDGLQQALQCRCRMFTWCKSCSQEGRLANAVCRRLISAGAELQHHAGRCTGTHDALELLRTALRL